MSDRRPFSSYQTIRLCVAIVLVAGLGSAACAGQRKAKAAAADAPDGPAADLAFVSLSQGACFGTCPVFSFQVAANGVADYTGKRYAPYPGLHHGKLTPDTLARLMAMAQAVLAKADELPREIETGIMDYSQTTVTIATSTDTITFKGTTEFAEGVDDINELLRRAIDRIQFTRDPDAEPLPVNQLRLVLKSADQIQVVQENYYRQQFKVVKMLSEEPAAFLISFDPYAMNAEEMIASLRGNAMVLSAGVYATEDKAD